MKRIIVTDSSANLLNNEPAFYNIKVLPLTIMFDNHAQHISFDDEGDLESANPFDELLANNINSKISTSFVPINTLIATFDELLIDYDQIIYIPIDSLLSSQYGVVKKYLETQKKYKNKVLLIDANAAGPILKNIVLKVNALINLPNFSFIKICKYVVTLRSLTSAYFIPFNISFIQEGGRFIKSATEILDLIQFKVILEYSLKGIHKYQMSRTFKFACDKALNALITFHGDVNQIDNLVIAYSQAQDIESSKIFAHELAMRKGIKNISYLRLANTITAHVGPGCIVFIGYGK